MATPFLKWAGGKSRLVPMVAEGVAGLAVERYIEPFLGGGAMFFGLRARGLRAPAILADANPELMATFAAVRDDPEAVIAALRPLICDEANLFACAEELAGAELRCADFAEVCAEAGPGDFVYLDPPYHPLSATARFTAYTDRAFGWDDQVRLAGAVRGLAARGAWFALSNSAHPAIAALYEGLRPLTVQMSRAINSKGDRRAPVEEYLFFGGRRLEPGA